MIKKCIVVPVYKELNDLTLDEKKSLIQLFKILGSHTIFLVGPSHLLFQNYAQFALNNNVAVGVKVFDQSYFTGIEAYNRLMLSTEFYRSFSGYDYMLIYQTDAFVFKDELNYWCGMKYDYIGAPWFKDWHLKRENRTLIGVGNGGFSLRNIKKARDILKRLFFIRLIYKISLSKQESGNKIFRVILFLLNKYLKVSSSKHLNLIIKSMNDNEDFFWCVIIGKVFYDFTIATVDEALKFSFENHPEFLFEKNGNQLPFGCHGWQRYNPSFWQNFIDQ